MCEGHPCAEGNASRESTRVSSGRRASVGVWRDEHGNPVATGAVKLVRPDLSLPISKSDLTRRTRVRWDRVAGYLALLAATVAGLYMAVTGRGDARLAGILFVEFAVLIVLLDRWNRLDKRSPQ